jgi:hypothetical protein
MIMISVSELLILSSAPTTSPGFGMGACHHGGSRFIAIDTPLCPRFMPGPWAFFRNTYLLHDIGAASPVAPDFSNAGGSPVCCLDRVRPLSCPATRRDSNGLASARPAGVNTPHSCPGLALQFRDSEFAGFSFKNPAPTKPPRGERR